MSYYLGLDSSTQSLKGVIVDADTGKLICHEAVNFGSDLPHYNTPNGVLINDDPSICHSDPSLWMDSLDLLLSRMQKAGAPLDKVCGICGAGQQHGTVYVGEGFSELLNSLDPNLSLSEQVSPVLSRKTSPIWMDSSTGLECDEISNSVDQLREITGSVATRRFSGPQIRRFYKTEPESYAKTEKIHLVSSFMCSLLCGDSVSVDVGDGSGMNLLNLNSCEWDEATLNATAPGLKAKLPSIDSKNSQAGKLHPYFSKYGFKAGTAVTTWTGDNPASLVGTGAFSPGEAVISLGTSDTFFAAMDSFHVDPAGNGHVFGNPAGGFMSLICFSNGSLARENVRNEFGLDWEKFAEVLNSTPSGNSGVMMTPYFVPEITPVSPTIVKYSCDESEISPEAKVRALVEAQFMSMKIHSSWIGEFSTIFITGGASKNREICQIIADIFQVNVAQLTVSDTAAIGAAMMAAESGGNYSWQELKDSFAPCSDIFTPNKAVAEIYSEMTEKYKAFSSCS